MKRVGIHCTNEAISPPESKEAASIQGSPVATWKKVFHLNKKTEYEQHDHYHNDQAESFDHRLRDRHQGLPPVARRGERGRPHVLATLANNIRS